MSDARRLLELAVNLERAGSLFYEGLSGRFRDREDLAAVFGLLAREEEDHARTLAGMKASLRTVEVSRGEAPEHPETRAFERLFSDARLSGEKAAVVDLRTALEFAIRREIDTIFLYQEMTGLVSPDDRPVMRGLVEEERGHFRRLSGFLSGE